MQPSWHVRSCVSCKCLFPPLSVAFVFLLLIKWRAMVSGSKLRPPQHHHTHARADAFMTQCKNVLQKYCSSRGVREDVTFHTTGPPHMLVFEAHVSTQPRADVLLGGQCNTRAERSNAHDFSLSSWLSTSLASCTSEKAVPRRVRTTKQHKKHVLTSALHLGTIRATTKLGSISHHSHSKH